MHADDLALVVATLRGEAGAIDAFVDRLRCVARFLASRNRRWGRPLDDHALCDLVQDVMTLLWRKRASYEGRGSLESWACATGLLQFFNCVRRRKRDRLVSVEGVASATSPHPEGPDTVDRQLIGEALEGLPAAEREIIVAKHFEGRTFTEIAEVMDLSPNTAKTRYYRGLEKLRRSLAPLFRGWSGS